MTPSALDTCSNSHGNREVAGDDALEFAGRHAATYWVFQHLEGLRRVPIPETALFDAEGVLEAWIYAAKGTRQQAPDCQISRREVLETNVLRFEARLQDLSRDRQGDVVAVHRANEPEYLDERSLDALVRVLCARELAMNAVSPDLRIQRAFPGGGSFCLQEFVPASDRRLLVARFQHGAPTLSPSRSESRADGGGDVVEVESAARDPSQRRAEDASALHRGRYSFSTCRALRLWELEGSTSEQPATSYDTIAVAGSLQARLRELVQLVLAHFHVFFGLQLLDVTLEFAHDKSCDSVHLVGAQSVKARSVSRPTPATTNPKREQRRKHHTPSDARGNQSESARTRRSVELHASGLSAPDDDDLRLQLGAPPNHRVCRQCRKPQDVELAKELALKQATMRRVLANLQSAQEERAAALRRDLESQESLQQHRRSIAQLQRELDHARESAEANGSRVEELAQENAALKLRLAGAVDEAHVAQAQVQLAEERRSQADLLKQSAVAHQHDALAQQLGRWETHNAQLQTHLSQLQKELERSQQTLRKLQAKHEEVRADRDELRFQRRFVWRKLVDVKEPGVAPPQRIAGGYRSYPAPSNANVRDVVKWLVDYDAKRAVVEASKTKSIGRRLKLKLELMRVLGSPKKRRDTGGASASAPGSAGLGSRSPRRRSRSPSKRSPPRRSRATSECEQLSATPTSSSNPNHRAMTLLAEAAHRHADERELGRDKQG